MNVLPFLYRVQTPAPPQLGTENDELLYVFYLLVFVILVLLGVLVVQARINYSQSSRHTEATEKFTEAAVSFKATADKISETTNRRMAVFEERQAGFAEKQNLHTQQMLSTYNLATLIQTDLSTHSDAADEYIKASNSRETETLNVVRGLPAKIEAVSMTIEQLHKKMSERLDLVQQQTRDHIDHQFDAYRQALDSSFNNLTVLVSAQAGAPDEPPDPPTPEPPSPPPPTNPASAPPPDRVEQPEEEEKKAA